MNIPRSKRRTAADVEVRAGYGIRVTFADGVQVDYDLADTMKRGVSRRLQPRSIFERVQLGESGGAIGWPDPDGKIEPLLDIGNDTIRRKGHRVAGSPTREADEVFWQGEVPDVMAFDVDDWVATLMDALADALETLELGFEDATAVLRLPDKYRVRLRTTNMVERLNSEIRRREKVIRIFPNEQSAWRLVGAYLMEQHEEWATGRRYLDMDEYWAWKTTREGENQLIEAAAE